MKQPCKAQDPCPTDQDALQAIRKEAERLENICQALKRGLSESGTASLKMALETGSESLILSVLKNHACDLTVADSDGNTVLHWAIKHDQGDIARWVLAREPRLGLMPNHSDLTPLMLAAACGRELLISLICENAREERWSADILAAEAGHAVTSGDLEKLQYLEQEGLCLEDVRDDEGFTLLHMAASMEQLEIARYLLSLNKPELDPRVPMEYFSLHFFGAPGSRWFKPVVLKTTEQLESFGFPASDSLRPNSLHLAIAANNPPMVELLIESVPSASRASFCNTPVAFFGELCSGIRSPLMLAADWGFDLEIYRLLLTNGADPEMRREYPNSEAWKILESDLPLTPMEAALAHNDALAIQILKSFGARNEDTAF